MSYYPTKSQIFVILAALSFVVVLILFPEGSANPYRMTLIFVIAIMPSYLGAAIMSAIIKLFSSLSYKRVFYKSLQISNIVIGLLIISFSIFGFLYEKELISAGQENSEKQEKLSGKILEKNGYQIQVMNWSKAGICQALTENDDILILPIFEKQKNGGLLSV